MYIFLLFLVSLIWGSTFFIIKDTVTTVDESFIVFVRTGLAFFALLIYNLLKNPQKIKQKKAFFYGTILGFLLASIYLSQTIGLKFTSTGHSAFITGSAVVIVPFLLFTLFKHKIFKIDLASVGIVLVGLFFLTYDLETDINIGDIITLITAISLAFHIVFAQRFVKKADAGIIVLYQFMGAMVASLVAFMFTNNGIPEISVNSGFSLLYLGLIGTLVCYFITVWVQQYVPAIKVSLILATEPVFAALCSFIFINETLNPQELLGATLILSGVIIHNWVKHRIKRKAARLAHRN
ncbi:DMT family transporter [Salinivirga cyanobacteriivorans]